MRGVNASESRRCGARINSRSNSASTVSIKRPCAVIVSAHAAHSGDCDRPFQPKVITDSGDRDHAAMRPIGSA